MMNNIILSFHPFCQHQYPQPELVVHVIVHTYEAVFSPLGAPSTSRSIFARPDYISALVLVQCHITAGGIIYGWGLSWLYSWLYSWCLANLLYSWCLIKRLRGRKIRETGKEGGKEGDQAVLEVHLLHRDPINSMDL